MTRDPIHIVAAVAVGIGATLLMDAWNLLLKRIFGIPSLDYCLLGRWLHHMPAGTFRHTRIAASPRKAFECEVGLAAHYSIGVVLAIAFVLLAGSEWLVRPTPLPALIYGVATVVFPYFVMQPSFGLGIAGSRAPHPARVRLKSLVTHVVFGLGLYGSAAGVGYVLRAYA